MADGSAFNAKDTKKKPRIAFTGEEFGFGYQAVGSLVADARRDGVADGGKWAVSKLRMEREIGRPSSSKRFSFAQTQRQPLRTKEQALMAVKSGTADYAIIPFYSPYAGYDFESLRALGSLITLLGVQQVDATDKLCLAVHESQVLELAQSAHPQSALSNLVSRRRSTWGSERSREETHEFMDEPSAGEMHRGGLVIDQATQLILRDRLDSVYSTPDAIMRCKSKLDGLRGAGVEVQNMTDTAEPHRDFARMSRQSLSPDRMVNTYFNPSTGDAHYVSAMNGASQSRSFYGVVLPFEVADRSSEYIIIDPDMEDSEPSKTRFMVVENNPDHTLYDDAYRTTDAKTRYWSKRLRAVATNSSGDTGVRVMMRFRRDGSAASIGDVENFLRNYGVRHSVVRLDEDSEKENPAPILLDVEFDAADFEYNPLTMCTRRWRGSVANGAIKKAFQRWKNRGVLVLAAMPYETPQLPTHSKRRWWSEAVGAWAADFVETMFIRFSRVLFFAIPVVLLAWFVWTRVFGG